MNSSYSDNYNHCHPDKGATTLDVTIVGDLDSVTTGTKGNFYRLKYGHGDKTIIREELACRSDSKKKKPLAAFIQITDVHIIDATSPGRLAFLAQYIPEDRNLNDGFRPQEALSNQVAEAMIRKINSIKKGPKTGRKIGFVISTGDQGDSEQKNELQNFINLLDGRKVTPNPATPGNYIGVQDNQPTVNYAAFYHPDPSLSVGGTSNGDLYKTEYGFPDYPNILNEASQPFCATGLNYPWYNCNGNHDCTKLGNYGLGSYSMLRLINQLGTGNLPEGLGSKLIQAMDPAQARRLAVALTEQNAEATLEIIKNAVLRNVPRSEKRLIYTKADFVAMNFNTTLKPGPVGHGFTEENRINNTLYYSFPVSETIDGFVLDTCNPSGNLEDPSLAPNGSIGRIQLSWLESELIKRHKTYYNTQGQLVCTKNENKLCVLFSHHDDNTMNNIYNAIDDIDNDPQRVTGTHFISFVQRFPNVILWTNGHTHFNRITPLVKVGADECHGACHNETYNGFWEINTCSHIDYPEMARIIEIADNGDGTLSIFGTLINHLSPANVDTQGPHYTITEMASISRTLAYNDPFNHPKARIGLPTDRNVELVINNPLLR